MLSTPLLLGIIAIYFSSTVLTIVDPKTNSPPQVKLRSWEQAIVMAKAFVAQL